MFCPRFAPFDRRETVLAVSSGGKFPFPLRATRDFRFAPLCSMAAAKEKYVRILSRVTVLKKKTEVLFVETFRMYYSWK